MIPLFQVFFMHTVVVSYHPPPGARKHAIIGIPPRNMNSSLNVSQHPCLSRYASFKAAPVFLSTLADWKLLPTMYFTGYSDLGLPSGTPSKLGVRVRGGGWGWVRPTTRRETRLTARLTAGDPPCFLPARLPPRNKLCRCGVSNLPTMLADSRAPSFGVRVVVTP